MSDKFFIPNDDYFFDFFRRAYPWKNFTCASEEELRENYTLFAGLPVSMEFEQWFRSNFREATPNEIEWFGTENTLNNPCHVACVLVRAEHLVKFDNTNKTITYTVFVNDQGWVHSEKTDYFCREISYTTTYQHYGIEKIEDDEELSYLHGDCDIPYEWMQPKFRDVAIAISKLAKGLGEKERI